MGVRVRQKNKGKGGARAGGLFCVVGGGGNSRSNYERSGEGYGW